MQFYFDYMWRTLPPFLASNSVLELYFPLITARLYAPEKISSSEFVLFPH